MKNPVAVTFVDRKFLALAQEQGDNFRAHGLEHEIVLLDDQRYGIYLWLTLFDRTIEMIRKHGRIFRVDAEIRMLKDYPTVWNEQENVLFFIDPIATNPLYVAINTGHMVLGESSILFLENLRDMTHASIPPNYIAGNLGFDDEDLSAAAIAVSKISYRKETISYDRSDNCNAAFTRGNWYTSETVLTHPFLHNWNTESHMINNEMLFRNHFRPGDTVRLADAAILGLKRKTTNANFWKSIGFEESNNCWKYNEWMLNPEQGTFWNEQYPVWKSI